MAKICDVNIKNNKTYFTLHNCSSDDLIKIIDYKAWTLKSWKAKERKYFTFVEINRADIKVVWCSIGFAPLLIRYVESLGYIINGKEYFRSKNILIGNIYYNLWDYQEESVETWIRSGMYGIIKIPTGSGKSVIACNIISRLKVRTIICVHTSDLLINVWYNNLVEQFGESIKSKIGIVGGGLSKKRRMEMRIISSTNFHDNIKQDIVIASSQTLMNNTKLMELSKNVFGLVILDEIHRYPAKQFSKVVSFIRAPYKLGLSATLVRPDGMSPLMYGLVGNVVYNISIKELIKRNKLVQPVFKSIIIDDLRAQNMITHCGLTQLDYVRYVKNLSAGSVIKKDYILKLINSLVINDKKFILYTDYVDDTNNVFTRDYYVKQLTNMGIYVIGVSSEMDSNEREYVFNMLKNNEINGIVFGKLGSEGVNIPNIDSVVMCNATKSTILFPQRVGRGMRKGNIKDNKINAFIYEVLLNTPKELEWSKTNFYEYASEGFDKEFIHINSDN